MATHASEAENALLVRLIEEGLFVSYADNLKGDKGAATIEGDKRYLAEQVFPTLVPALHDLLKCYKSRLDESSDATLNANKQPDPVMWLAQYLLRNNANAKNSRLAAHPFQAINAAVLHSDPQDN